MQPGPPHQSGPQGPYGPPPQGPPPGQYPPGPPQGQYPYPGQYPPPRGGLGVGAVVLIVVCVVIGLGGLGVGAYFLITAGSSNSATSKSSTPAATTAAGTPDRYKALPDCAVVGSKASGLPPLRANQKSPSGTSSRDIALTTLSCDWSDSTSSPLATATIRLSESASTAPGAGTRDAQAFFANMTKSQSETAPRFKFADQAAYKYTSDQCTVLFQQGNISGEIRWAPRKRADYEKSACLAAAQKVADATSEALGP